MSPTYKIEREIVARGIDAAAAVALREGAAQLAADRAVLCDGLLPFDRRRVAAERVVALALVLLIDGADAASRVRRAAQGARDTLAALDGAERSKDHA